MGLSSEIKGKDRCLQRQGAGSQVRTPLLAGAVPE